MKTLFAGMILLSTLAASACVVSAQQQESAATPEHAAPFMRVKLAASQDVLNGLVTENFQLIQRGAEDMKRMSQAVQWPTADDPVYKHFGVEFRRQCDKLKQLATEQNLQGAQYTWLHMTSTCIDCHNYVRSAFRVEHNAKDPKGPIRLIPTDWPGRTFNKEPSQSGGDR